MKISPIVIGFLIGINTASAESMNAVELLTKMESAIHSLNYQGQYTYLHNNHMESMQVTHLLIDGVEHERLYSLNGEPREVVRDNKEVICVQPNKKTVSVEQRNQTNNPSTVRLDPQQLSSVYQLLTEENKRIAGFDAIAVKIIPKDKYRYGHVIYLDNQYFLPLKSDLINTAGETISQIMFTSLTINPSVTYPQASIQSQKEVVDFEWSYQPAMQEMDTAIGGDWTFKMLPKGFKLQSHARRMATDNNLQTDHFIFSDGLASLSIYVEKPSHKTISGSNQMGPINVYGKKIHDLQVTAVGEVPQATVKAIVSSMSFRQVTP